MILRRFSPTLVSTILAAALLLGLVLVAGHGDPLYLARLGSFYSQGDPDGDQGYDGQFVFYIARDPHPTRVAAYLDVPAYRYQRILLPLLARLLALGSLAAIPWALILTGLASYTAGVWVVERFLVGWNIPRCYAYLYALWAGILLALIVDLPEPLAYALAGGGLLALQRRKTHLGWLLLTLALFAKEMTAIFLAAVFLDYLLQRRWKQAVSFLAVAGLPFAAFQVWLWITFGQPGIGSGGVMATPFEWLPFMGLLRIGSVSLVYLLAMIVVFGPTVVWPAIWGAWQAVKSWRIGETNMVVLALLLHALATAVMPFSTFREPGGVLRYATGQVLALLFFCAQYRRIRALNYCAFWIVLNVFLFK